MLKDQLFGLNGLVNLSNLLFLAAFSVKDVLALRALSIVSYCVILPYYYFQQDPLWQPLFWGMTFIIINGFRIALLILERRPVGTMPDVGHFQNSRSIFPAKPWTLVRPNHHSAFGIVRPD